MVILDSHVLVQDVLEPRKLSARARRAVAGEDGPLAASDISLWEIAMLIARGRIEPGMDAVQFVDDLVQARAIQVLPITPKIAVLAQSEEFRHGDPADRLIAATAIAHGSRLVTADAQLRKISSLRVIW